MNDLEILKRVREFVADHPLCAAAEGCIEDGLMRELLGKRWWALTTHGDDHRALERHPLYQHVLKTAEEVTERKFSALWAFNDQYPHEMRLLVLDRAAETWSATPQADGDSRPLEAACER